MKILLVCKSKKMENLGCMYLKSVIQFNSENECRIVSLDEAMYVGINWEPQIIGYSIMTGDEKKFHRFNQELQMNYFAAHKKMPTSIVGAQDPTFFPEGYEWADIIIPGEAEQALADLLHTGKVYGDIDSIPWPARDDFPKVEGKLDIRDFIASRGCPYNKCKYCFNARWKEMFPEQARLRIRDYKDVVAEIKFVNPEYAYFQDSCFGVHPKWFEDFCQLYSKEVGIPYQCHMRPEQVSMDKAKLLAKSNCVAIKIALESSVERLRQLVGRGSMQLQEVINAITCLHLCGVKVALQNIIGLPTASIEDDLETLRFNIEVRPDYAWVSIYVPYPGTALGDMCKEKGWYKGNYEDITDSFFDKSVLEFPEEHKEQLYCLQKIFALCVETNYLPKPEELTLNNLPKLVHRVMRNLGDKRLYG